MLTTPPPPGLSRRQRIARIVLATALVLLGAYILQNFLRALVWAVILVIATWPLYRRAQRRFPTRPGSHDILLPTLFTAAAALLVVAPLALAAIQLGHEARTVAAWVNDARAHGAPVPEALAHLPLFQPQVATWWQANLADPESARALLGRIDRAELMQAGRSFGTGLLHRAILFGFTLVTLFFLYREGHRVIAQLLTASERLLGRQGETLARQIVASIRGTVDGLVLVGLGVGILLGIAYAIAGIPHPALLGAATAIAAMIPLGAPIVLAIACLLAMAATHTLAAAILAAFGMTVIFIADHFIRPAMIGGATRLPFIWVLLGILGGVETLGLLGLFAGPATMAALILLWRDWVGNATNEPTA